MKKILLLSIALISLSAILTACGKQELAHGEGQDIPPVAAANKKAAEAYANEDNIKETKAEHSYDASKIDSNKNTIVIGEKLFLTQINDIYNNFQRYDGKTVVVEGMLGNYTEWDKSFQNAVVFRNGPGCCGNDGWGGFFLTDVNLEKGDNNKYRYIYNEEEIKLDDWIKVTGKPQLYEATDTEGRTKTYLFLQVEDIENHKDKDRGAEYVAN